VVPQEPPESKALPESKDLKVPLAPLVYMDQQDHKAHKVHRGQQAYKATLVPLVNKDLMVPLDLKVPLVYRALTEPQVPLDLKVLRVSQEI
jgi:hypothetical protein